MSQNCICTFKVGELSRDGKRRARDFDTVEGSAYILAANPIQAQDLRSWSSYVHARGTRRNDLCQPRIPWSEVRYALLDSLAAQKTWLQG